MQRKTDTRNVLLTPEQVAERLSVSVDWVRDHSSRKNPRLPVIRLGGGPGRKGLLRYRACEIEKFISELALRTSRMWRFAANLPGKAFHAADFQIEPQWKLGVGIDLLRQPLPFLFTIGLPPEGAR